MRATLGTSNAAILRRVGVPALFFAILADVAAAHEVGATRPDSPIPLSFLFLGGRRNCRRDCRVARKERTVHSQSHEVVGTVSADTVRSLRTVARTLFVVALAFAGFRGSVGRQVAAENVATRFVWPLWLKRPGLTAVLFGSPWRALSPWRGIHAAFERLEGDDVGLASYPGSFGVWPAVIGFVVVVGVVENLTVISRSPQFTAGLVALYAAVMLLGGILFGESRHRRADFLEVLYARRGRVAPVDTSVKDERHTVGLRFPWRF